MTAIARDVARPGGAVMAGIEGTFAVRVAAARRSGLPADQVAAIIHQIMQEKEAAMKAAGEATAKRLNEPDRPWQPGRQGARQAAR